MRDTRPYFDNDLGIPWDESQLAIFIAVEAAVDQQVWGRKRGIRMYFDYHDVDARAVDIARRAGAKLRAHPSHHKGKRWNLGDNRIGMR